MMELKHRGEFLEICVLEIRGGVGDSGSQVPTLRCISPERSGRSCT